MNKNFITSPQREESQQLKEAVDHHTISALALQCLRRQSPASAMLAEAIRWNLWFLYGRTSTA